MIEIIPTGGLCDRIVTIESFISIAKELNKPKMKMIWLLNDELHCNYEEILQPIPGIIVENKIDKPNKKYLFSRVIRLAGRFITKKILGIQFLYINSIHVPYKYQHILELLKRNTKWRFFGLLMSEKPQNYYSSFIPVPEIGKVIDNYADLFTENTVGVHIRRTDNFYSIENSPSELFYNNIEKEIETNPNVKFYIATDSEIELRELIKRYGNRIIFQKECVRSRITNTGLKSAVIDLFLLSRTKRILGSDWSAFSTTAAKLGNIELIKMKKNDN